MTHDVKHPRSQRRLATSLAITLVSVTLPCVAWAQPSKEDVAKADVLFRDAQILVQKGHLAEGCAKFAESQRFDPANGTLLNLAICHEKEGKVATAYRELQELLALMSNSKNPDDRERTRVATERVRALDKKVPRVTFDVTALPKDATLQLDGDKVTDPAFPVLVDPGPHTVVASAAQKKPGSTTFDVKDAGPKTVKLDALADEPPPPPPPPAPEVVKPTPKPEETSGTFWSNQRILGAGVAGVGLIGLGVGTVFGLDTFSKRDARDTHCVGTVCDAEGIRLHDEAGTSATISSIAFGVGALALGVGAYLFISAPSATNETKRGAARVPRAQVGFGPMSVAGTF